MKKLLPLLVFLTMSTSLQADEAIDYARDIKPLLAARCYSCHGEQKQRSGLRLDTATAVKQGGDSGPAIVPGKSEKSLLIQAVLGANKTKRMPPTGDPLAPEQIALLKAWIDQGGKGPAAEVVEKSKATANQHWAYKKPVRPAEPTVRDAGWVRNPMDRFILARLEKEGLTPSPEADRTTLVRRLYLDLLGLLPSPDDVATVRNDKADDWYDRLVEKLLASPHYGERWGRHWLDLARYADSNGFNYDYPRLMWKYRDWVIDAINRDLPFDQFTIEQIAGDLLPGATLAQRTATGFHRNTMNNDEAGSDAEQFRTDRVVDRVNTTGTVWLGLTVGCAQCHDHKYDPLSQREYYQLFAFFNNAEETILTFATPGAPKGGNDLKDKITELKRELKVYTQKLATEQKAWEKALTEATLTQLDPEIRAIARLDVKGRSTTQRKQLADYFAAQDTGFQERQDQLAQLVKEQSSGLTTLVLREGVGRKTHVLKAGDFLRKGVLVAPGVPEVLPSLPATKKTPNRLDLARWLVDPANPLTARVAINRLWQNYFGKGLVETEDDFGVQGSPPSHPELLDWLASEFSQRKWSMKGMHRLIVTSATYRQSSRYRPDLAKKDPANRLLGRQPRLRLEAEIIRDVALTASGLLNPKVGGPSVFPPQPSGLGIFSRTPKVWTASIGPDRFRRGMYTHFWRSIPHPALVVFDAPDANTSCSRRNRSNTPLQALTLANDPQFVELAEGLSARLQREAKSDDDRLRLAFRICLGREPAAKELSELRTLLTGQPGQWTLVSRVLLNLDEFITRE